MGKRNSPMKAKVFMANAREFRISTRELRDDGVQRRLAVEPLTVADLRAQSVKRGYVASREERVRHELAIRASMTPEQRAARARFIGDPRNAYVKPARKAPRKRTYFTGTRFEVTR